MRSEADNTGFHSGAVGGAEYAGNTPSFAIRSYLEWTS
jgi:hypothetical protein